jgi:hypothetical protein
MSHEEWLKIPWWVRQVYIEGMFEEELLREGPELEDWELDPTGAGLGSFRGAGFKVIDGG